MSFMYLLDYSRWGGSDSIPITIAVECVVIPQANKHIKIIMGCKDTAECTKLIPLSDERFSFKGSFAFNRCALFYMDLLDT